MKVKTKDDEALINFDVSAMDVYDSDYDLFYVQEEDYYDYEIVDFYGAPLILASEQGAIIVESGTVSQVGMEFEQW